MAAAVKPTRTSRGRFVNKKVIEKWRGIYPQPPKCVNWPEHEHSYAKYRACEDRTENSDIVSLSDVNNSDANNNHDNSVSNGCCTSPWLEGRRVVELDVLQKAMYCVVCSFPLHFSSITGERKLGLGSVLKISCRQCNTINDVPTGKRNDKGAFDVNSKAALGMVHAGIGPTHFNNLLTSMNIPAIDPTTLKKKETEIGEKIVEVAQKSCNSAISEELQVTDGGLEISYDAGWQKRGTGWQYNSNTGHASVVGKHTGKILHYDVRSKTCQKCNFYTKKGLQIPKHNCPRNWTGSSKAMEPDMAMAMLQNLKDSGCDVSVLHMDDDATTLPKVKTVFQHISKRSDKNHVKKGFSKCLHEMSKKHNLLKQSKVLNYIVRCFTYAVEQNKDSKEGLCKALSAIVPHMYGEHSECRPSWCGYHSNPEMFKFKSLPQGKPLTDMALRTSLEALFTKYGGCSGKLLNLGSSQANESFNQIVSTKAPKSRSYGASQSLVHRVSAAAAQKNKGYSWVAQVSKHAGFSPGLHTMSHSAKMDRKRKWCKANAQKRNSKRRRVELKQQRLQKQSVSIIREGDTYKPNIALNTEVFDVEQIPEHITLHGAENVVVFDLETSSLSRSADILQLSALYDDTVFNRCIIPRGPISAAASQVNGLTCQQDKLYKHGVPVPAVGIAEALLDFMDFLRPLQKPILIGHNISSFDVPVLSKNLSDFNFSVEFSSLVVGFVDTLPISRQIFPKTDVGNYKQETLVRKVLDETYEAHNAVEDVKSLQKLFTQKLQQYVTSDNVFLLRTHILKKSLEPLVTSKRITIHIAKLLAKNGIGLEHLKLAHSRNCVSGIAAILNENLCGTCVENSGGCRKRHMKLSVRTKYIDQVKAFFGPVEE